MPTFTKPNMLGRRDDGRDALMLHADTARRRPRPPLMPPPPPPIFHAGAPAGAATPTPPLEERALIIRMMSARAAASMPRATPRACARRAGGAEIAEREELPAARDAGRYLMGADFHAADSAAARLMMP